MTRKRIGAIILASCLLFALFAIWMVLGNDMVTDNLD